MFMANSTHLQFFSDVHAGFISTYLYIYIYLYPLKLWKKHCLAGSSSQGRIKGSHPHPPPPEVLETAQQMEARGTHAGTRWHSRRSPSSTAGRWRKEGTFHSPHHKYYVCNDTPACQTHSLHTRLRVRYIYTWGEKRHSKEETARKCWLDTEKGCSWRINSNLWMFLSLPSTTVNWGTEQD